VHQLRSLIRTSSIVFLLTATGCVWLFRSPEAVELTPMGAPVRVLTPVKAHLHDGSTILYRTGLTVTQDSLLGNGMLYGVALRDSTPVSSVSRRRVAALSRFQDHYDGGTSFVVSALATAAGAFVGLLALLAVACSGGGCG